MVAVEEFTAETFCLPDLVGLMVLVFLFDFNFWAFLLDMFKLVVGMLTAFMIDLSHAIEDSNMYNAIASCDVVCDRPTASRHVVNPFGILSLGVVWSDDLDSDGESTVLLLLFEDAGVPGAFGGVGHDELLLFKFWSDIWLRDEIDSDRLFSVFSEGVCCCEVCCCELLFSFDSWFVIAAIFGSPVLKNNILITHF